MPSDGEHTRRAVLAAVGSAAGTGTVAGTALAETADGPRRTPGEGSSDRKRRPRRQRRSPTRVAENGVVIEFETCQVAELRGDGSAVERVTADFELYDVERDDYSHHRLGAIDIPEFPVTVDASNVGHLLPEAENAIILGQVELYDGDHVPLASLSQPTQWRCRTMLR
jgi:hypothetical protein